MFGKKESADNAQPTAAELAAEYPDQAAKLRTEGAESVDVAGTVSAEAERIIGLAEIRFGAEAGKNFRDIVTSGVTVDQYAAIAAANPPQRETAETETMGKMLDAITGETGQETPGAELKNDRGTEAQDFESLVADYQKEKGVSKAKAIGAVAREHPDLHEAYIAAKNAKGGK